MLGGQTDTVLGTLGPGSKAGFLTAEVTNGDEGSVNEKTQ